ncbi:hypothetical protein Tco_0166385 [Tanacetum coccineum]
MRGLKMRSCFWRNVSFMERTKNMLTGKWTLMNASVLKFNQLVQETAVHSGENDDDHMSRVHTLYDATVGGEFKHRSAWLFLKGKHKWKNPDSTLQRRNRLLGTDEEPKHFGDNDLPRPPGLQRLAKSQHRRRLIQSQRIAEDMRVLQIDTRGMDAADAAIINAQKARIRAAYTPPPN